MKMQKKIKNINNNKEDEIKNNDLKKLLYLVLGVAVVFFIFYGITLLILKKDEVKQEETKTEIDLNQILISQLFEQPESHYYVLVTISNDANNNTYESLKEEYYKKENHLIIYKANLNDPLNSSFAGDKTDLQGNIKNVKFNKSTLVEIEDKTIKSIFEGSQDILEKLNSMK